MADGKVSFAYSRFLGLEKDKETGKIVVNPEQAKIVRLIFKLFLEGMTPHSIAAELTNRGIKTPGGKDVWNRQTVRRILSNEKYKGDALLQKTYTVDFLQKKLKRNEGEVPQFYVEGNHEAIISPEVFIWCRRNCKADERRQRYSGVSIFFQQDKMCRLRRLVRREGLAFHGPLPQSHLPLQPQVQGRKMSDFPRHRGRGQSGVCVGVQPVVTERKESLQMRKPSAVRSAQPIPCRKKNASWRMRCR